jgi:pectate lyase
MRKFSFLALMTIFSATIGIPQSNAAEARAREGRLLKVGPGEEFTRPSEAARAARSGDTVTIAPGTYVDCAVWPKRINGLTIEGNGATIGDRSCAGKGIFVIAARNVVIRGITFRGARVRDHNGAGIRSEARNLTVEDSRFIDNENGILTNNLPLSTVTIRNSYFEGNGSCEAQCAHGIYANHVALLRIEGSEFVGQREGHHIKSRARRTELFMNHIHDGPDGTASYLVDIPNGGDVLIANNTFEKGPRSENRSAAITIGEEGANAGANRTSEIRIENNNFKNVMPGPTIFVRNSTGMPATLRNNMFEGKGRRLVERSAPARSNAGNAPQANK